MSTGGKIPQLNHAGAGRFVLPRVVYEIEPGFVAAARLDAHSREVRRLSVREIGHLAVEPVPHRSNLADPEEVRVALNSLSQVVGNGGGASGLLIPDGAVRVGILEFEKLAEDAKDAEALIRWRMRENLPCAPEEARLTWQTLRHDSSGVELFVVAAKMSVLEEYERLLEPSGGALALLLPSTAALLPLIPEDDNAGQLLLHVCARWVTAVVLEGNRLRSWRAVELKSSEPGELAREAGLAADRVAASARDHLKVEVKRVYISERPLNLPGLEDEIGRAVSCEVTRLSPPAGMAGSLSQTEQSTFENFGGPFAGLVSNLS
jgi:hypothetical protein